MKTLSTMLKTFWLEESGLSAVEYAVAGALVILVAAGAFVTLGGNVNTQVGNIATAVG